jgi:hypothetical protein
MEQHIPLSYMNQIGYYHGIARTILIAKRSLANPGMAPRCAEVQSSPDTEDTELRLHHFRRNPRNSANSRSTDRLHVKSPPSRAAGPE